MKRITILVIAGIIFLCFSLAFTARKDDEKNNKIAGFTIKNSQKEREIEAKLKAIPEPEKCKQYLRYLTENPHIAGTEENHQLALYVRDKFREFGLDEAELAEYQVLLSYPKEITIEMIEPKSYKATLREEGYPEDKDSYDSRVSIGFNAYSASGEVIAPVVYAHGGNPEDYDKLLEMGIDIKGKIALVRYSMPYSYRGFKALTAQKRGAAALLIYSDPMDDGYMRGETVPHGPWGPESHIQRGGIPFDFMVPGDPLSPGWASIKGAKRIKPEESEILPTIISVPLSYKDARPLLENLAGSVVPEGWQGGLPFTYHVGPGPAKVHMKVEMDNPVRSIWDVIGTIKGNKEPEKWVVIGNHRDAWVYGGVDPNSGTSTLLELARTMGKLVKEGYRPDRSIIFCNWDAEEYTLTGSTEWSEQWVDKLRKDGIIYINVDSSVSGPNLDVTAMPSLKDYLPDITKEVSDPNSGKTVYDAWKKRMAKYTRNSQPALTATRVGSGSDHTAFLNFVCMPVISMGFDGPYGVYHSQYDNFYWMEHFGDPTFRYHTTMSVIWGMTALRMANADIFPYNYADYAQEILIYIEEIKEKAARSLDAEFTPLQDTVKSFQQTAQNINRKVEQILASENDVEAQKAAVINNALIKAERCFGNPEGIPKRPWFKHLIYAPRYTYAAMVLPGITEAVEEKDWERAKEQIKLLQAAISKAELTLNEALKQIQ
jgi:N-acetylated-alpha-linked acidic dipeptidase